MFLRLVRTKCRHFIQKNVFNVAQSRDYLENCGVRKLGKTTGKGDAGYEAGTFFYGASYW